MEKENIILIGMPGVGKSTVGVILAKILGCEFIDADIVIQKTTGKLLSKLISENGAEGFIKIEDEINASIEPKGAVIATGGSAVYGKNAMEHYKEVGRIVYLKVSYEQIERRLKDIKSRGVVLKNGQNLKGIYDERSVLYEKYADIIIDEDGHNIEETLNLVLKSLKNVKKL